MSEISARYRALSAEFTRRVQAVPDERWEDPSPCEGWTARDVLRHMLDNHLNMPGHAGVKLELTRSADDDPEGAWAEARDAMQAVLDDPARAGAEYEGYFGRTNVADTVDRFLGFDLLVHAWDIARATGQDETLPADQVHRYFTEIRGLGDAMRSPNVCGPEVPVPDDAPEQDRFLGFIGRTP
ncbi:TIGR03086 family metal-binding protein [Nocardiopsis mangrovi]|uniref:TIGR03086 family metal-binding protein n=1 Tax=Nocardiopsis mangrovi TaxID=1179818 RepID=A0ABV9E2P7_9ACTN